MRAVDSGGRYESLRPSGYCATDSRKSGRRDRGFGYGCSDRGKGPAVVRPGEWSFAGHAGEPAGRRPRLDRVQQPATAVRARSGPAARGKTAENVAPRAPVTVNDNGSAIALPRGRTRRIHGAEIGPWPAPLRPSRIIAGARVFRGGSPHEDRRDGDRTAVEIFERTGVAGSRRPRPGNRDRPREQRSLFGFAPVSPGAPSLCRAPSGWWPGHPNERRGCQPLRRGSAGLRWPGR